MGLPLKTKPPLTAQQFMVWYDRQPDGRRYELLEGVVHEMQGERAIHARLKFRICRALDRQIGQQGLPCEAFVDGMAVQVDSETVFEPDVLLRCGERLADDAVLIKDPMIVVEVMSPSSQRIDALDKLTSYFLNPSIIHYLIVMPTKQTIIHHQRMPDGRIVMTPAHKTGVVRLDPPGVEVDLAEVFGKG